MIYAILSAIASADVLNPMSYFFAFTKQNTGRRPAPAGGATQIRKRKELSGYPYPHHESERMAKGNSSSLQQRTSSRIP